MEFLHLWSIDLRLEPASRRRAAANDALRQILAIHLPAGAPLEIVTGEHGKPRLAHGGLEFNLSHSGCLALVAVSAEHPVGVDVEKVEPDRDPVALAERALEAEDAEAVRAAPPPERALVFHQRWVRHEARLKCLGIGVFNASTIATAGLAVQDLAVEAGYVAAMAIDAPRVPPQRCWTFDPESASKRRQPG